jgi:hypothetical protein
MSNMGTSKPPDTAGARPGRISTWRKNSWELHFLFQGVGELEAIEKKLRVLAGDHEFAG